MVDASEIEARMHLVFPPRIVRGPIATHDCDECEALRKQLGGATWEVVPVEFVDSNYDALPLLTQEAYAAFLPAWLRQAVRNPRGLVADMLLVNLREKTHTAYFTLGQSSVILDVAHFIVAENPWGLGDPVNAESVAAIEEAWGPSGG